MEIAVPPGFDERALRGELEGRITTYPHPPEGFDPLAAGPRQLERFGFPPRPDPAEQPRAADFWDRMFVPTLTFVPLSVSFAQQFFVPGPHRAATGAPRESSLNWSGAYVTPRDGRQFIQVLASWVVPDVDVPSGTSGSPEFRSSTWIGLDGQKRYLDSSLPQIGTAQFVNAPSGIPPFSAWWQWWLRDHKNPPVTLPLTVAPGHAVMASLLVLNDRCVKFSIVNRTTNRGVDPFDVKSPRTDPPSCIQVKVSGATAEWILERPADLLTGMIYELPDYDEVDFTSCLAVSAELSQAGLSGPGREHTLEGARLVNMYRVAQGPPRTVTISKAKRLDVDRVGTTYVD
jgi:hypothetical protein